MMDRRALLAGTLAGLVAPVPLGAQQPDKVARSGVLSFGAPEPFREGFRRALVDLDYVEGRNVAIEHRWADGQTDRLPMMAAALVRANVNLIVAAATPSVQAAMEATRHKPPFAGPEHVLAYLGRYTHRVALSNDRLVAVADGRVRFRRRDYANGDRVKVMDLDVDEFLRRFLLHVVPDGFVRIRHFGLLANRRRAAALAPCRALLAQPPPPVHAAPESLRALLLRVLGIDIDRCAVCHRGALQLVELLPPAPAACDTSGDPTAAPARLGLDLRLLQRHRAPWRARSSRSSRATPGSAATSRTPGPVTPRRSWGTSARQTRPCLPCSSCPAHDRIPVRHTPEGCSPIGFLSAMRGAQRIKA
jgi:hypothetical protein